MAAEKLVINGVEGITAAWRHADLSPLLDDPPMRGSNRLIPHAAGRRANPRYVDENGLLIPWLIFGNFNADGTSTSDAKQGLKDHFAYLRTHLGMATQAAPAEVVTAVWHLDDASTLSADVLVLGWRNTEKKSGGTWAKTSLELLFPGGGFDLT